MDSIDLACAGHDACAFRTLTPDLAKLCFPISHACACDDSFLADLDRVYSQKGCDAPGAAGNECSYIQAVRFVFQNHVLNSCFDPVPGPAGDPSGQFTCHTQLFSFRFTPPLRSH